MFSLFLGNWVTPIDGIVQQTDKATLWFFISYVLLVAVVFSQLCIGIILDMYGGIQAQCEIEYTGKVKALVLRALDTVTEEECDWLIYHIGKHEAEMARSEVQGSSVVVIERRFSGDYSRGHHSPAEVIQRGWLRFRSRRAIELLRCAKKALHNRGMDSGAVLQVLLTIAEGVDYHRKGFISGGDAIRVGALRAFSQLNVHQAKVSPTAWIHFEIARLSYHPSNATMQAGQEGFAAEDCLSEPSLWYIEFVTWFLSRFVVDIHTTLQNDTSIAACFGTMTKPPSLEQIWFKPLCGRRSLCC